MATISSGGNATVSVGIKGVVYVEPKNGAVARVENPAGTLVAEFSDRRSFGPMTSARSVKIISVSGTVYYEQPNAGYSVTQATSKSAAVQLDALYGEITMNAASLASNTLVSFTLNCNQIDANDTLLCHRKSGGTAGSYEVFVDSVQAGQAVICVRNISGGALAEAVVLAFSVQKNA